MERRKMSTMEIVVETLIIVLLLWFLVSCGVSKPQVITRDSVRIEYRERVVKETDTIVVSIEREIVKNVTKDTASFVETSYAESSAVVSGGLLFHTIANKEREVVVPTEKEIVYRDSIVFRDKYLETIKEVNKLTKWQRFKMMFFWICLGALIIYVLIWYFKKKYLPLR